MPQLEAVILGTVASILCALVLPSTAYATTGGEDNEKLAEEDSSDGFLVAQATVAEAANRASAETQTPTEARAPQLQEVTVTAQRREEDVNRVPVSITAFSQKTMDDLHIQSLSDLASIVPGVDIPLPNGGNNANPDIAIRGIFSGGNTPTTQIYIDETPIAIRVMSVAGPAGSFFPDIFDLDRVEVLRGPQGTLFGSSAMGGAIRFITPQPNLEEASGYAKAEIAASQRGDPSYAAGVAYGAPIEQGTAGFRVSGWFHSDGGFIDAASPVTGEIIKHNANASDAFAGRAALTIAPTEGLTITPALLIQHQHSDDLASYWASPYLGYHTSGDSPLQPSTDNMTIPSLAIKYELPGMTLQSDTSYLDRWYHTDDDITHLIFGIFSSFTPSGGEVVIPGVPSSFRIDQAQLGGTRAWQQEVRLTSSNTSRLQWVVGAYYREAHETLSQRVSPDLSPMTEALFGATSLEFFGIPDYVLNGQVLTELTDFNTVDEEKSLFGDVSFDITARLKASAGVRVEHSVVKNQQQVLAGPFGGFAYYNKFLPEQSQNPVTPRFALTYQYTDQDMIYATAAKGYRSGGANSGQADMPQCLPSLQAVGLTAAPDTFNSDSLWSYELGAKDALFGGRLAIQTSVFYIDWTNIQTQVQLPVCGQNFTGNRGRAVVQGFELQFEAVPMEGLKLGGFVAYTDAYYPDAAYGAPSGGVAPLLNGAGDRLAMVLPWTAAAHAEYSWSIGALWNGARSYIRADLRWLDGYPKGDTDVANYNPLADEFRNEAYSTLNLRLGVAREGVDLSAFVNNVTHADPRLTYFNFPGLAYQTALRPLTAGVTVLYHF